MSKKSDFQIGLRSALSKIGRNTTGGKKVRFNLDKKRSPRIKKFNHLTVDMMARNIDLESKNIISKIQRFNTSPNMSTVNFSSKKRGSGSLSKINLAINGKSKAPKKSNRLLVIRKKSKSKQKENSAYFGRKNSQKAKVHGGYLDGDNRIKYDNFLIRRSKSTSKV